MIRPKTVSAPNRPFLQSSKFALACAKSTVSERVVTSYMGRIVHLACGVTCNLMSFLMLGNK